MSQVIYKRSRKREIKTIIRFLGLGMVVVGFGIVVFIFTPYVFYQLTSAQVFASQKLHFPIPQLLVVTNSNRQPPPVSDTTDDDMLDAENWFPTYENSITVQTIQAKPGVTTYTLTIPRLGITNAVVSTTDLNLAQHLVDYPGTAIPPQRGNAVVFGHSTLPSLFNPSNYRTILANAYHLAVGDKFIITVAGKQYVYDIYNITVVDPDDTSVFAQDYSDSYFTLITCVPPGTVYQRLVVKSRLEE